MLGGVRVMGGLGHVSTAVWPRFSVRSSPCLCLLMVLCVVRRFRRFRRFGASMGLSWVVLLGLPAGCFCGGAGLGFRRRFWPEVCTVSRRFCNLVLRPTGWLCGQSTRVWLTCVRLGTFCF